MSGTIGAHWRHANRHARDEPAGSSRRGLPLFVAVPFALLLTGALVTITALLVERFG